MDDKNSSTPGATEATAPAAGLSVAENVGHLSMLVYLSLFTYQH
jgi:hypothetical protein